LASSTANLASGCGRLTQFAGPGDTQGLESALLRA
jgi:hypothetical protein